MVSYSSEIALRGPVTLWCPPNPFILGEVRFDLNRHMSMRSERVSRFRSHVVQRRVCLLAKHFGLIGIDWNDAIADALHVFGNGIACTPSLRRETDYCDCLIALQDFFDRHSTLSNALRNLSFCSRVPTDTRMHVGQPHAGRTITPCFSNACVMGRAGLPSSRRTKFAWERTYFTLRLSSPA